MKILYKINSILLFLILIGSNVIFNNTFAQTGYTTTAPTGGGVVFGGAAFGSGTSTVTITRPTSGCYAYGINTTENNGFTFASSFSGTHVATNKFQYSGGLGTSTLTLNTSSGVQTMSACTPRAAISITPILTLTTSVGVWYNTGTYYYVSTKNAATTTINVTLKSPTAAGTDVNTLANNLCSTSWHSWSNLNWGWLTLAAPTASPTNTGPYCSGGTIALTANPSTTNLASSPATSYTYLWSGTGTFSSTTTANPTVTSGATGNYSVVVTDNYGCPATSVSTAVTIKAALDANTASYTLASCGLGTGTPPAPYADLSATAAGAGVTGTWTVTGGSGSVTSVNSNATQITGLSTSGAPTTLTWKLDYNVPPACTNISPTLTITPPNLSSNLSAVSLENTAAASSPHVRSNCKTCTIKDGNTYTYYDATGKIMMKVVDKNPPTPDELGSTEICVGYDYTPPTAPTSANVKTVTENYYGTQQPYLPREWTIKPTANTNATVTLYFTNAELLALQNKANGTLFQFSSYNTLVVSKFPGGGTNSYTAPPAASGVVVPSTFGGYNSDHQVTFDVNTFSTFYVHPTIFPNAVLPVELTSFTGKNIESRNELDWTTASEINTEKFVIEKSDGGSWTNIGEVSAAGNSNTVKNYQFFDILPLIGNNFYRLKIIDFDGQYSYSNTINVPLTDAVSNGITNVFPNPSTDLINVGVQSITNLSTTLIVYDVLGKSVIQVPVSLNKGYNVSKIDISLLNNGVYIIQFKDNENKIHTAKFFK